MGKKKELSVNENCQLHNNKRIYIVDGSVFNFKKNKYPLGLIAKTDCFRVFSSVWNKECESFVLARMKATWKNIKPVVVIDETTLECVCKIPNSSLTEFTDTNDTSAIILCTKIHQNADFKVKSKTIQLDSSSCSIFFKNDRDLCRFAEKN